MEKIIKIEEKEVALKTTGATLLRYKMQFGKDLLSELIKLEQLSDGDCIRVDRLDFELFYNILWALAKTADPNIKPPMEWFEEFESIPIMEIIPELMEMLNSLMATNKKKPETEETVQTASQ